MDFMFLWEHGCCGVRDLLTAQQAVVAPWHLDAVLLWRIGSLSLVTLYLVPFTSYLAPCTLKFDVSPLESMCCLELTLNPP